MWCNKLMAFLYPHRKRLLDVCMIVLRAQFSPSFSLSLLLCFTTPLQTCLFFVLKLKGTRVYHLPWFLPFASST
jgi:hypothetical protein